MLKRSLAFLLVLCLVPLLLSGCATSLEGEPNGVRPDDLDGSKLPVDFPPRSAVSTEFNSILMDIERADSLEAQREAYERFHRAAFIYVMGPYSYMSFLAADGANISLYQEESLTLLTDYLNTFDPQATQVISAAGWGGQLLAEYAAGAVTPDKILNAYPTSTSDGQEATQAVYNTRARMTEALENGESEEELASLLQEAVAVRQDIASQMGYDNYLAYYFQRRDNVPYTTDDVRTLAQLVRDELAPVLATLPVNDSLPALSPEEWTDALPELIQALPALTEDLRYCLDHDLLSVQAQTESSGKGAFSFPLYQYGASIGRARLDGGFDDALTVAYLLGSMSSDLTVPSSQWALSQAQLSHETQAASWRSLALPAFAALYGADETAALQEMQRLLLQDVCRSAMVYDLMLRLYEGDPEQITAAYMKELTDEYSAAYGLPLTPMDVYALDEVLLGTSDSAQELLGGLAGLQLLLVEDEAQARSLLDTMMSVYNYGYPVTEAVKAGLPNPYGREAIQALAEWYRGNVVPQ